MVLMAPRNHLILSAIALVGFVLAMVVIGHLASSAIERTLTVFLISLTAIAAMGLYSGNSGILSFGHLAFMAVGAYGSALLTLPAAMKGATLPALPAWLAAMELGLWPATAAAVLLTLMIAALVGLAIWRLDGSAATIATLSLLIVMHGILIGWRDVTRGAQTFFGVPRDTDIWAAGIACALTLVVARLYRDSAGGLKLRAGRDDAIAAAAVGIDTARERFWAFVLSAALMAIAGALLAHFLGAFSPKKFYFVDTFFLLAMLIVGGMATVTGAVLGATTVTLVTELLRRFESGLDLGVLQLPQVFGTTQIGIGVLILLALMRRPDGLSGLKEWEEWLVAPKRAQVPKARLHPADQVRIKTEGVTKRFGGVTATEGVSIALRPGEILGLIGPNGSGKTTLLNQLSGVLRPTEGRILQGERDLIRLPPHRFVEVGIARTFQNIRLFRSLSVYQNVQAAALSTKSGRHVDARTRAALDHLGLMERAEETAGTLAYGDQRRVEIARSLVCEPSLLLLDEPAAGMNREETDALMTVLQGLNRDLGIGILLVDHDLKLINALCDRIVVLNEGRQIAEGSPETIRTHPAVIEAYLGRTYRDGTTGPQARAT